MGGVDKSSNKLSSPNGGSSSLRIEEYSLQGWHRSFRPTWEKPPNVVTRTGGAMRGKGCRGGLGWERGFALKFQGEAGFHLNFWLSFWAPEDEKEEKEGENSKASNFDTGQG
jgi:hypothetical protein